MDTGVDLRVDLFLHEGSNELQQLSQIKEHRYPDYWSPGSFEGRTTGRGIHHILYRQTKKCRFFS